jgi:hypothetical protein
MSDSGTFDPFGEGCLSDTPLPNTVKDRDKSETDRSTRHSQIPPLGELLSQDVCDCYSYTVSYETTEDDSRITTGWVISERKCFNCLNSLLYDVAQVSEWWMWDGSAVVSSPLFSAGKTMRYLLWIIRADGKPLSQEDRAYTSICLGIKFTD